MLSSGCGLVANGTTRYVPARSHPPGAEVWVDGELVGHTPVRIEVDPDREHRVKIRAAGYEEQVFAVRSRVSVVFIVFDVLLTGGVGLIIDALTDGWDVPEIDSLEVDLERHDP